MNKAGLHKISDHVFWMPPAKPDRPSLCAIVGFDMVVALDAGASSNHAGQFLDQLSVLGIPDPNYIVLTHWHWDHVFGADRIGGQIVAHHKTARILTELSKRDWSDAGLKLQIADGLETKEGAMNIEIELPSPRDVRIAQASVIFQDSLVLRLGNVSCQIRHVGGDHAEDSSVIFVEPDRVLFLGDCLSSFFYSPKPYYTVRRLALLLETLEEFDADLYIEGHNSKAQTKAEFSEDVSKMHLALSVIEETGPDEEKAFERAKLVTGKSPDEDTSYYLRALINGFAEQDCGHHSDSSAASIVTS